MAKPGTLRRPDTKKKKAKKRRQKAPAPEPRKAKKPAAPKAAAKASCGGPVRKAASRKSTSKKSRQENGRQEAVSRVARQNRSRAKPGTRRRASKRRNRGETPLAPTLLKGTRPLADIERLRNIAFVGPHHAGKTTLVEAILAHTGAIGRRGTDRRRHDRYRPRAGRRGASSIDHCRIRPHDRRRHRHYDRRRAGLHRLLRRDEASAGGRGCRGHRRRSRSRAYRANAGDRRSPRVDADAAHLRHQQDGPSRRRLCRRRSPRCRVPTAATWSPSSCPWAPRSASRVTSISRK